MTTDEAIEFVQKELVESSYFNPVQRGKLEDIQDILKSKQELVTKFSMEGDEYQKKLDQIDESALIIENAIKRIRGKI